VKAKGSFYSKGEKKVGLSWGSTSRDPFASPSGIYPLVGNQGRAVPQRRVRFPFKPRVVVLGFVVWVSLVACVGLVVGFDVLWFWVVGWVAPFWMKERKPDLGDFGIRWWIRGFFGIEDENRMREWEVGMWGRVRVQI